MLHTQLGKPDFLLHPPRGPGRCILPSPTPGGTERGQFPGWARPAPNLSSRPMSWDSQGAGARPQLPSFSSTLQAQVSAHPKPRCEEPAGFWPLGLARSTRVPGELCELLPAGGKPSLKPRAATSTKH